jgi:hypothetical protein
MKAILINPEFQTITEVEFTGDHRAIYSHLGKGVDTFDVAQPKPGESIYVDDEGLLKADDGMESHFFEWEGLTMFAGNGLVLGCDADGNTTDTSYTVEEVRDLVHWHDDIDFVGFEPINEVTGPDHWMGEGIPVIGHRPVFRKK